MQIFDELPSSLFTHFSEYANSLTNTTFSTQELSSSSLYVSLNLVFATPVFFLCPYFSSSFSSLLLYLPFSFKPDFITISISNLNCISNILFCPHFFLFGGIRWPLLDKYIVPKYMYTYWQMIQSDFQWPFIQRLWYFLQLHFTSQ